MCFELFDVRAVEDRPAGANHAGPYLRDAHQGRGGVQPGQREEAEQSGMIAASRLRIGFNSVIREKSLLVKEKWAFVLTPIAGVCYRR